MTNEKILSICIPTYNRASLLNRLLGILETELLDIHDIVDICISDNCSTDETQQICLEWQKKLPIVYSKNLENIGYDRNVLNVTKMVNSKYLWFMGDDDLVVNGSVKKLVRDIANVDVGVVYLNQFFRNQWVFDFDFKDFRIFKKEELKLTLNSSFGGAICLNRLVVFDIIDNLIEVRDGKLYKKNFGNFVFHDFVHTYLFLECLLRHGYIGIAPLSGMEYMASAEVSCSRKFYTEFLMVVHILEIKKYYPWFKEEINKKIRLRAYLSRLAIVNEDPSFEDIYYASYNALLKVLALEKKPIQAIIVKLSEMSRKLPLLKSFWIIMHNIMRRKFAIKLNPKQEQCDLRTESIRYLIHRAKELM